MLYRFNLILDSNQSLTLFRQKQIFRSNRHKNSQKQDNEDSFFKLVNTWLHFTNSNFPTPASTEKILNHPIFLNVHTKLNFCSDNPYFYCIPPSSNFLSDIWREITANHERIYKLVIDFDWKHLLRTETFQKSLLKTF